MASFASMPSFIILSVAHENRGNRPSSMEDIRYGEVNNLEAEDLALTCSISYVCGSLLLKLCTCKVFRLTR